ncbi:MAG TPA: M13 family metallopeptidase [Candidatus Acidoferrales bacterium]|nr:M13 family metallopeptidase [Candidatus Acidoferrales bacterium]
MRRFVHTLAASAAAVLLALGAVPAGAQPPALPAHGIDLADRDTTCAPCRDFFRYANGAWDDRTPIPASYSRYGVDREIEDRGTDALRRLLEQAAADVRAPAGSDRQRLGLFYGTCMDSARAEADGAKPLVPLMNEIAKLASPRDLAPLLAQLHAEGVRACFRFGAEQDAHNSSEVIAGTGQGGLGLPDRDYYLRTDSASVALRQAYVDHAVRSLVLAGVGEAEARDQATRILALETRLARASMTRVQMRDPNAIYHRLSLAELQKLSPSFDWGAYLRASDLASVASLNVAQPEFVRSFGAALDSVPMTDWQAYLRWAVVRAASPVLSSAFVNEDFRFNQRLTGARVLSPRWQRCLEGTDRSLGEALGQEYVRLYFTPEAKQKALEMVHHLEDALRDRLSTLPWMSDSTRRAAVAKLAAFDNKIGYPDHWRDYSALTLHPGAFVDNLMAAERFEWSRRLHQIGRPLDRTEWHMTPPTVNAYYSPSMNEIVFPAGILQPPYWDPTADDAFNYGSMGAVIGHEMTHGFDDEGRQYDLHGNLRNWWTPADAEHYKRQAARMVAQFNGFVAVDTLHVNGQLTLGENIADLGGLVVAWDAWQKVRAAHPQEGLIDGYTPEQRFFLGYAQSWREKTRPERQRMLALTNPHAPEKWRVNGPLADLPEFARAFGCHAGDPMVQPDSLRVVIW